MPRTGGQPSRRTGHGMGARPAGPTHPGRTVSSWRARGPINRESGFTRRVRRSMRHLFDLRGCISGCIAGRHVPRDLVGASFITGGPPCANALMTAKHMRIIVSDPSAACVNAPDSARPGALIWLRALPSWLQPGACCTVTVDAPWVASAHNDLADAMARDEGCTGDRDMVIFPGADRGRTVGSSDISRGGRLRGR